MQRLKQAAVAFAASVLLSVFVAGCASTKSDTQSKQLDVFASREAQLLKPGDSIDVQVYREPDLSGTFVLDEQGSIRHPLLGYVRLQGFDRYETEYLLTSMFGSKYLVNPQVFVTLHGGSGSQVVVLGEVNRPGVRDLATGESWTLLKAIAEAGGFTDLAALNRVKIIRKTGESEKSIRVKVPRIIEGEIPDIELKSNDVIMVPQILF